MIINQFVIQFFAAVAAAIAGAILLSFLRKKGVID